MSSSAIDDTYDQAFEESKSMGDYKLKIITAIIIILIGVAFLSIVAEDHFWMTFSLKMVGSLIVFLGIFKLVKTLKKRS